MAEEWSPLKTSSAACGTQYLSWGHLAQGHLPGHSLTQESGVGLRSQLPQASGLRRGVGFWGLQPNGSGEGGSKREGQQQKRRNGVLWAWGDEVRVQNEVWVQGEDREEQRIQRSQEVVPYFHSRWRRVGTRCTWIVFLRLWEQRDGSLSGHQTLAARKTCPGWYALLLSQIPLLMSPWQCWPSYTHKHTHIHTHSHRGIFSLHSQASPAHRHDTPMGVWLPAHTHTSI